MECTKLAIQIEDIYSNSFYILWDNGKIFVEPYSYDDRDVLIVAPQHDLELLFSERQYIFSAYLNKNMKIDGSFGDVMSFQRLISFITKDNFYTVQEEIISNMLLKQDALSADLGIIMESLQLLLTNSLLDLPSKFVSKKSEKSIDANFDFSNFQPGQIVRFGMWNDAPIEWIVLSNRKKTLLIVSKEIVIRKKFHSENTRINLVDSDLLCWLNDSFYNVAFSSDEKNRICTRNNQVHKILLLKKNEVENYFEYVKKCKGKWWTATSTPDNLA